jgi:amino acid adenylation domain-containing protein
MRIETFLVASAQRAPDKVALVSPTSRLTYGQIDDATTRLAHGLIAEGVRRGDRVAIYLENSVEAVLAIFATLKAGGVFVMVNPSTKSDKLSFILNNSRPRVLITDGRRQDVLQCAWTGIADVQTVVFNGAVPVPFAEAGKRVLTFESLVNGTSPTGRPSSASLDLDLAALIYTSGSTGRPKGVMLNHVNMVAASTSITTYLQNRPEDRIYNALPLSFDYGLYQVLMTFQVGATLILDRSFVYPHSVLKTVVEERVTGLPIVPTMAAILLRTNLAQYDLASLRYISSTGAELLPQYIRQVRTLLPHVQLFSMYGLTECKRVSYLPPGDVDARPTSVGKGMPNQELWIIDDAGNRVRVGTGELVIRGSHVMQGYWEMPEETDRVLKPGLLPGEKVLRSGDVFRVDEDGYLYFVRRKDDIIKSRGEKVSPREIENVLHQLPGVAQAAVVGVPDPILGEAIKAILTLHDGSQVTTDEVLTYTASRLEDLLVPDIVEFRSSLPLNPNGKIDKQSLRASQ